MSLAISGMGWVTPLGKGVPFVWERLLKNERPVAETISSPLNDRAYPVFRVPPSAMSDAPIHPRLRRSSAISRFAAIAGLSALDDAQITLDAEIAARTALVFAISNGGVIYTKRFYHEVVESGAQAASPLLFPETVFNAPASHLAAILGLSGATYTLVGDGAVGLLALKMAEDLMQSEALDRCLVIAAEETDWLLCNAYAKWRLLRSAPPIETFESPPRGMILSEGAGAILLERSGTVVVDRIEAGSNFAMRTEAAARVDKVFAPLCDGEAIDLVIASANGTFIDLAERRAILRHCPDAVVFAPKQLLGESVGASALWQLICAAESLRTQRLPASSLPIAQHDGRAQSHSPPQSAVVPACGLNQQVAGARLRVSA